MAFSERIRGSEIRSAISCGICDTPATTDAYLELHSFTTLHVVLTDEGRYLVTDTPAGHKILQGKTLSAQVFQEGTREHDGVCLCPVCHDEIHRIALAEAKLLDPKFRGKIAPPKIMEEVTLFFVNRKRSIVYDVV